METKDLFLTSEERYDVYCVKASERPHLLETYQAKNQGEEEEEEEVLPLMDGCDIASWRAERLFPGSSLWEAALNVGLGCPLLRREAQLPLPSRLTSQWETLREFLWNQPTTAGVERVTCDAASQFIVIKPRKKRLFSKWEEANYPVIVTEATTTSNWNLEAWKYHNLVHRFQDVRWRFSDTHGAMMTLGTYAKYIATEGRTDDSPLAVYDSEFGDETSPMHCLVDDYQVPPCFSDDLFSLALQSEEELARSSTTDIPGLAEATNDDSSHSSSSDQEDNTITTDNPKNSQRPPWRWILMGTPRSGTGLHIDPLWTNAWVTLLEGTKRWILIPPHLTDQLPEGAGLRDPQVPSVIWFRDYYQQVIQLNGVVEILQRPGETVFVPNGWPHLVLNLDRTVAVTHNYASEFGPFQRMWKQVLQDEPEFAQRWHHGLQTHRPDLAAIIDPNNNPGGK